MESTRGSNNEPVSEPETLSTQHTIAAEMFPIRAELTELTQLMDERSAEISKRTAYQTRWGVGILKEWLKVHNPESVNFETITMSQLDRVLVSFYPEAKNREGKCYAPAALMGLRAALSRHLSSTSDCGSINIAKHPSFTNSNRTLQNLVKIWRHEKSPNKAAAENEGANTAARKQLSLHIPISSSTQTLFSSNEQQPITPLTPTTPSTPLKLSSFSPGSLDSSLDSIASCAVSSVYPAALGSPISLSTSPGVTVGASPPYNPFNYLPRERTPLPGADTLLRPRSNSHQSEKSPLPHANSTVPLLKSSAEMLTNNSGILCYKLDSNIIDSGDETTSFAKSDITGSSANLLLTNFDSPNVDNISNEQGSINKSSAHEPTLASSIASANSVSNETICEMSTLNSI